MDIKILGATVKKVRAEDIGYKVEFFDAKGEESLGYSLEVVLGSTADVFLRYLENDFVKIAVLDGRIIALVDSRDNKVLLRDVILPNFEGRLADDNINYIKETYGVRMDTLETQLDDLIKTSHLRIVPMSITDKSKAYDDGIYLELGNKFQDGTHLYCPSGSLQSEFFLRMAGLEMEDYEAALEKLVNREFYLVVCSRDMIAVANKETKEVCVLYTFYDRSKDEEDITNRYIKMIEDKYGIVPSSLDGRIKMLLKNNEESK